MHHESQPLDRASGLEPTEDFDFEPLYDLSERDYQSIIHRLVDAVVGTVGSMRQGGQIDEAYELTNQVNDILLDYDDDVAELVWTAAYGDEEPAEDGLGAARASRFCYSGTMVGKLSDQLVSSLLALVLREWQTLWAIASRLVRTLFPQQPQGIFEVLDYDSTLELLDAKGSKATFRRRQKVRFLQDHVIAFQDYAWGDGDVLADYKISPGIEADRYREGDRWNILISLRETKSRGDVEEFHIERTVRDGFTKPTEWRQLSVWLTTRRLRMAIIFPKSRHCKHATLHRRGVDKAIELDGEYIQPLPDGRQIVSWEEKYPKRAEIYTIRWEW